jgi:hypothetical protein
MCSVCRLYHFRCKMCCMLTYVSSQYHIYSFYLPNSVICAVLFVQRSKYSIVIQSLWRNYSTPSSENRLSRRMRTRNLAHLARPKCFMPRFLMRLLLNLSVSSHIQFELSTIMRTPSQPIVLLSRLRHFNCSIFNLESLSQFLSIHLTFSNSMYTPIFGDNLCKYPTSDNFSNLIYSP